MKARRAPPGSATYADARHFLHRIQRVLLCFDGSLVQGSLGVHVLLALQPQQRQIEAGLEILLPAKNGIHQRALVESVDHRRGDVAHAHALHLTQEQFHERRRALGVEQPVLRPARERNEDGGRLLSSTVARSHAPALHPHLHRRSQLADRQIRVGHGRQVCDLGRVDTAAPGRRGVELNACFEPARRPRARSHLKIGPPSGGREASSDETTSMRHASGAGPVASR